MKVQVKEAARSKYLPDDWGYYYVHLQSCPTDWQMQVASIDIAYGKQLLNHWRGFIKALGYSPSWIQTFTDGFQAGFQTLEQAQELADKLRSYDYEQ